MSHKLLIRDETERDTGVIAEVTVAAFQSLAISNHTEQFIVEALRFAGPVSVLPIYQRMGIGKALIK